jgi:hypothetical protein
MGLARMGWKTILFEAQEYRFHPSVAIRNTITDDGRVPVTFVDAVDQELDSYPKIETIFTKITCIKDVGTDNSTQFEVSNGTMKWTGRKLRSFLIEANDQFLQRACTISFRRRPAGIYSAGVASYSIVPGLPRHLPSRLLFTGVRISQ